MEQTKRLWESRTVWAAAVAGLSGIAGVLGFAVEFGTDPGTTIDLMDVLTLIAGVAAGYFRSIAQRKIA